MHTKRPDGIVMTLRTLMLIPAGYALIFMAFLFPVVRHTGTGNLRSLGLLVLLVAPWVIGMLVMIIARSGPVRNWVVPLLFSLLLPAAFLYNNAMTFVSYRALGSFPMLLLSTCVNLLLLNWFVKFIAHMSPRKCPGCSQRSLIPLLSIWKRDKRLSNTRWCASCGDMYWKNRAGAWQKERRKTWLDKDGKRPATSCGAPSQEADAAKGSNAHAGHVHSGPANHERARANAAEAATVAPGCHSEAATSPEDRSADGKSPGTVVAG